MSLLSDLLTPTDIVLGVDAQSKEQVFELAAGMLHGRCGFAQPPLVEALEAREICGSTGIGHGVAIPHARVKGLTRPLAAFVRTVAPIPFDAPDGRPVSIFIVLFVPEEAAAQHLKLLAEVAEMFSGSSMRQQLRTLTDPAEVYRLLAQWQRQ